MSDSFDEFPYGATKRTHAEAMALCQNPADCSFDDFPQNATKLSRVDTMKLCSQLPTNGLFNNLNDQKPLDVNDIGPALMTSTPIKCLSIPGIIENVGKIDGSTRIDETSQYNDNDVTDGEEIGGDEAFYSSKNKPAFALPVLKCLDFSYPPKNFSDGTNAFDYPPPPYESQVTQSCYLGERLSDFQSRAIPRQRKVGEKHVNGVKRPQGHQLQFAQEDNESSQKERCKISALAALNSDGDTTNNFRAVEKMRETILQQHFGRKCERVLGGSHCMVKALCLGKLVSDSSNPRTSEVDRKEFKKTLHNLTRTDRTEAFQAEAQLRMAKNFLEEAQMDTNQEEHGREDLEVLAAYLEDYQITLWSLKGHDTVPTEEAHYNEKGQGFIGLFHYNGHYEYVTHTKSGKPSSYNDEEEEEDDDHQFAGEEEEEEEDSEVGGDSECSMDEPEPEKRSKTLTKFSKFLMTDPRANGAYVIAHNGGRYDHVMVMAEMDRLAGPEATPPSFIMNGKTFISAEFSYKKQRIHFRDSLQHLQMGLAKMPSAFGLTGEAKGYFPYLYNHPDNYDKVLTTLPPKEYYSPDFMGTSKREEFEEWYAENYNTSFDLYTEMERYCLSDVRILRLTLVAFIEIQLVSYGYSLCHFSYFTWVYFMSWSSLEDMDASISKIYPELIGSNYTYSGVLDLNASSQIVFNMMSILNPVIVVTSALICKCKIERYLNKFIFTEKKKRQHRSLVNVLLYQTVSPFLSLVTVALYVTVGQTGGSTAILENLMPFSLVLLTVVSPTASCILIGPYRTAFFKLWNSSVSKIFGAHSRLLKNQEQPLRSTVSVTNQL
ncbi:hypothetical protein CRE_15984 [Caenorhabditis remanei]|uniref:DNA-directed DNA polymerase n=1 Tax=Caenorhabditis remanei TaxID=31234 RepID=E3MBY1_CAERE|nr:hypothetical protein CRE_15984 [Caenorhabditis remanei]